MTLGLLGLASCDRCRAARRWLAEQEIDYQWRDLREHPPDLNEATDWLARLGEAQLVNKRSATWRGLSEDHRPAAGEAVPATLLVEHPLLIRRPLWLRGEAIASGFDDAVREWLAKP
ncbi:MAG: ArsC/Spx/MgsR family protein [Wenzhouxiangellaceae bacterium]|nr:ArsC/Spx/MgsR family protein [Wenzhouxiangellaceae bacterium]